MYDRIATLIILALVCFPLFAQESRCPSLDMTLVAENMLAVLPSCPSETKLYPSHMSFRLRKVL